MRAWLSKMNLARSIILGSALLSFVLGWIGWGFRSQRVELEDLLALDVPRRAKNIQIESRSLTNLERERGHVDLGAIKDAQTYIRSVATKDRIELGDVNVRVDQREIGPGVVDRIFTVDPVDKERPYQRPYIANYMYMLEEGSGNMRVTHVKFEPIEKKMLTNWDQVPNDKWTFSLELTSREKKEDL